MLELLRRHLHATRIAILQKLPPFVKSTLKETKRVNPKKKLSRNQDQQGQIRETNVTHELVKNQPSLTN